jgi:hypothetical protein
VEEQIQMKKFSFLLALALIIGVSALSSNIANAQDNPQAEFERKWYESCQTKKDDQCIPLSKELREKYPSSQYIKYADAKVKADQMGKVQERFQTALKNYYAAPDAAKLDQLFMAGDEWLKVQPGQQFVIGQMALAGQNAVMSETYKDATRAKTYAEQALQAFEPTTPPDGWQKPDWENLRELVQAQSNQYLGYQLVQTKGDIDQALNYLNKAIAVKGKDGAGWKDPNNYWLRAQLYSRQYADLQAKYGALTDDEKRGEQGQALIKQVNEVLDTKLLPEYARVYATATKPEAKDLRDVAKKQFDEFWKYRTDDPSKAAEYLRKFEMDPGVEAPMVPAKAADASNMSAPNAPVAGGDVKLRGSSGAPGMSNGSKTTAAEGTKAAPTKKAAPKKKGRRN